MNGAQLECMIACDPVLRSGVTGVNAADRLPKRVPKQPYGFIANTQGHVLPGEHWCAFYDDGRDHVLFFDSYGRIPRQNSVYFYQWLRGKSVKMNTIQIQSDESSVCGLYCILFLRHILCGETLEQFVNSFDPSNTEINDSYVTVAVSRSYSECLSHDNGQKCLPLCKND